MSWRGVPDRPILGALSSCSSTRYSSACIASHRISSEIEIAARLSSSPGKIFVRGAIFRSRVLFYSTILPFSLRDVLRNVLLVLSAEWEGVLGPTLPDKKKSYSIIIMLFLQHIQVDQYLLHRHTSSWVPGWQSLFFHAVDDDEPYRKCHNWGGPAGLVTVRSTFSPHVHM